MYRRRERWSRSCQSVRACCTAEDTELYRAGQTREPRPNKQTNKQTDRFSFELQTKKTSRFTASMYSIGALCREKHRHPGACFNRRPLRITVLVAPDSPRFVRLPAVGRRTSQNDSSNQLPVSGRRLDNAFVHLTEIGDWASLAGESA